MSKNKLFVVPLWLSARLAPVQGLLAKQQLQLTPDSEDLTLNFSAALCSALVLRC